MTLIRTDTTITFNTATHRTDFCVVEHWASFREGDAPECVFVAVTTLADVYRLKEGRRNSKWLELFEAGAPIAVRIVALAPTRPKAAAFAAQHIKTFPKPGPICNVMGHCVIDRSSRTVYADTGDVYVSQSDAARKLAVSQAYVNKHLQGLATNVRGVRLSYTPFNNRGE